MAPMVLSYEPVNKNFKNRDDPNADSSEIEFMNPYLIVGVENLLWYGEILDNLDITVIFDQESDGEKPRTFEERYPMLAQTTTTTTVTPIVTPTNATTTPSPNQSNNVAMAAIFSTLFSNNTTTRPPLDTTSRTPLAPIPEESSKSTRVPLAAMPDDNETEKLYHLLHIFSAMQNANATSTPGEQQTSSQIDLEKILAELNTSTQQQVSQSQGGGGGLAAKPSS